MYTLSLSCIIYCSSRLLKSGWTSAEVHTGANMLESSLNKSSARNRCEDCGPGRGQSTIRIKKYCSILNGLWRCNSWELKILLLSDLLNVPTHYRKLLMEIQNIWWNFPQIADNCLIPGPTRCWIILMFKCPNFYICPWGSWWVLQLLFWVLYWSTVSEAKPGNGNLVDMASGTNIISIIPVRCQDSIRTNNSAL